MSTTKNSIEEKITEIGMIEMTCTCVNPWALEEIFILSVFFLERFSDIDSHDDQVSSHNDHIFYNDELEVLYKHHKHHLNNSKYQQSVSSMNPTVL